MFAMGDRVVYPLLGGAIIKDIEAHIQDGETVKQYILQMRVDAMAVSGPVEHAETLGVRYRGGDEALARMQDTLHEVPDVQTVKAISWNRRFQLYMQKIKSGSVAEVARIFKILTILERRKKISVGERRLLHSTKQSQQSEIMLIKDVDAEKAGNWLERCCNQAEYKDRFKAVELETALKRFFCKIFRPFFH